MKGIGLDRELNAEQYQRNASVLLSLQLIRDLYFEDCAWRAVSAAVYTRKLKLINIKKGWRLDEGQTLDLPQT